ncbi:MAG TPA: YqaJ viral recombinase family protein [Bryobacteraceae bacterium]
MIIHQVAQGTQAWLKLRSGIPTASAFSRIITPGGKASSQAEAYMNTLLYERVTGRPLEGFQSQWMSRGSEVESDAIAKYEFDQDVTTEQIGFVTDDANRYGCSPDRFIIERPDGMVEAKAPSPDVHISYLLAGEGKSVDKDYRCQLQGELWVCEKAWVDIIAFHPDLPQVLFRVQRDEEFIKTMAAHVLAFCCQLEEKAEQLRERGIIRDAQPEPIEEPFFTDADVTWARGYAASLPA